jgi:hypothetical protein
MLDRAPCNCVNADSVGASAHGTILVHGIDDARGAHDVLQAVVSGASHGEELDNEWSEGSNGGILQQSTYSVKTIFAMLGSSALDLVPGIARVGSIDAGSEAGCHTSEHESGVAFGSGSRPFSRPDMSWAGGGCCGWKHGGIFRRVNGSVCADLCEGGQGETSDKNAAEGHTAGWRCADVLLSLMSAFDAC